MIIPEKKFRTWHSKKKEWWYFTLSDLINAKSDNDYQKNADFLKHTTQSSGLLAKGNNKEIFEGCWLKVMMPMGGFTAGVRHEKIGLVKFEPGKGGFIVEWENDRSAGNYVKLTSDIALHSEVSEQFRCGSCSGTGLYAGFQDCEKCDGFGNLS